MSFVTASVLPRLYRESYPDVPKLIPRSDRDNWLFLYSIIIFFYVFSIIFLYLRFLNKSFFSIIFSFFIMVFYIFDFLCFFSFYILNFLHYYLSDATNST